MLPNFQELYTELSKVLCLWLKFYSQEQKLATSLKGRHRMRLGMMTNIKHCVLGVFPLAHQCTSSLGGAPECRCLELGFGCLFHYVGLVVESLSARKLSTHLYSSSSVPEAGWSQMTSALRPHCWFCWGVRSPNLKCDFRSHCWFCQGVHSPNLKCDFRFRFEEKH